MRVVRVMGVIVYHEAWEGLQRWCVILRGVIFRKYVYVYVYVYRVAFIWKRIFSCCWEVRRGVGVGVGI